MTSEVRDGRESLHSILLRADRLLEVNRPGEALPLLQAALRLNPENLHALASTARVHLALGDTKRALQFAEEAVRAEPQNEWGHRLRSIILQQIGKKQDALAAIETAASLSPESVMVLTQLFSCLRGLKRKEQMWTVAHRMAQLAPQVSASHINLGLVYLDYHRLDEAEAAFRRALQIDPESWAAMNNVGAVLQRKKRTSEAVEFFYRAAQLNPELSLPRSNLLKAGKKYLAGPATALAVVIVIGAAVASHLLDLTDQQSTLVFWCGALLAFAVGILGRHLRMRKLDEPLQRVLTNEQRRYRRYNLHRILLGMLLLFGLFVWLPSFFAMFDMGTTGLAIFCGTSVVQALLWAFWWRTRVPKL